MRSIIVLTLVLVAAVAAAPAPEPSPPPPPSDPELLHIVTAIRERYGLPALAAAVVRADGSSRVAATGIRRVNSPELVRVNDLFHIGSCTKAMTATVAAILVERRKISWSTTVGDVFRSLAPTMHADWRRVTLGQLLAHRSGAPADLDADDLSARMRSFNGPLRDGRRMVVESITRRPPVCPPGKEFLYSNAGYIIAGAMLETVTDDTWEHLTRRELFGPLAMASAGFGAPGLPTRNDQPRGHRSITAPLEPGPSADNPPLLGPAGTVHCSLADWGRFVALHLRAGHGTPRLLSPPSFKVLHASFDGAAEGYGMGWGVARREWAGPSRLALTHAGSNTFWYAVAWLAPDRKSAILVATNLGADPAPNACDEAAAAIIATIFRDPPPPPAAPAPLSSPNTSPHTPARAPETTAPAKPAPRQSQP